MIQRSADRYCAIDPGFRHMGFALLEIPFGGEPRLIHTCELGAGLKSKAEYYPEHFGAALKPMMVGCKGAASEEITYYKKGQAKGRDVVLPMETWVKVGAAAETFHMLAWMMGIERRTVPAIAAKWALTGSRKATKSQMVKAVRSLFPSFEGSHHEADAVAVAVAAWCPEVVIPQARAQ